MATQQGQWLLPSNAVAEFRPLINLSFFSKYSGNIFLDYCKIIQH